MLACLISVSNYFRKVLSMIKIFKVYPTLNISKDNIFLYHLGVSLINKKRKSFVMIKRFVWLIFLLALTTVARADDFRSVTATIKLEPKGNHGAYIEVSPDLRSYQNDLKKRLEKSIIEFLPLLVKSDFYPTQISSNFRLERDSDNPFRLILIDSLYPKNINEWVNGILAGCFNHYWQSLSRVDQSRFDPIFSVQPKWRVDVKSESDKFSNYLENNYKNCANVHDWRVELPDFIHMKMTSYFTSKRNNLQFNERDLPVAKFFDHIHTAQLEKRGQAISNQRFQSLKKWIENLEQVALPGKRKMFFKKSFARLKKENELSLVDFSVSLAYENFRTKVPKKLQSDNESRRIAVFVENVASLCLVPGDLLSPFDWIVSSEKCPFDIDTPEKGYFEFVFVLKSGRQFKFILPLIPVQE